MITINLDKAKEIKKNKLREERKALLESLDVEFVRALESGDSEKQQEIAAKKQALRDATKHPSLVGAESVEDLKSVALKDLV
jgi:uncharacterized protein YdaT